MAADGATESSGEGAGAAAPAPQFQVPSRAIYDETDLAAFHESPTLREFLQFLKLLNESVKAMAVSEVRAPSPIVLQLVQKLEEMKAWVDDIPPQEGPMRFGNRAFRVWHRRLAEQSEEIVRSLLPVEQHEAARELAPYLCTAFGNEIRIDYGTGHETTFCIFLFCLYKLGALGQNDMPGTVLLVFRAYMHTMRRLQVDYMLEPAGSRGVWGLDDYQVLVFYWGAAQLVSHPSFQPLAIHDEATLRNASDDYLYFEAVQFIRTVKQGCPFEEASPMLNDISGVAHWSKVNSGMMKLYRGEVVGKLPVMQHTLFGSLFPCTWTPSRPRQEYSYDPDAVNSADTPQTVRPVVGGGGAMGMAPWAT